MSLASQFAKLTLKPSLLRLSLTLSPTAVSALTISPGLPDIEYSFVIELLLLDVDITGKVLFSLIITLESVVVVSIKLYLWEFQSY